MAIFVGTLALLTFSCSPMMAQPAEATPSADTGIDGVILISPARGGPARQGVPDSAPLAEMEFTVRKGDETAATFKTDSEGKFRVAVPPGHYTVLRQGVRGRVGRFGPFEVVVVAGQMSKVEWICDSGLR